MGPMKAVVMRDLLRDGENIGHWRIEPPHLVFVLRSILKGIAIRTLLPPRAVYGQTHSLFVLFLVTCRRTRGLPNTKKICIFSTVNANAIGERNYCRCLCRLSCTALIMKDEWTLTDLYPHVHYGITSSTRIEAWFIENHEHWLISRNTL